MDKILDLGRWDLDTHHHGSDSAADWGSVWFIAWDLPAAPGFRV